MLTYLVVWSKFHKMKTSTLVVVLSIALLQCFKGIPASPLVPCPDEVSKGCPYHQEEFPVYYSHPGDCSKFCECGTEAIAWEVTCRSGLLWNDILQACDWAVNVDCGDRPRP
ncbi:peritrophin-1-like [Macrobrachium rosenbergii]|uniref:peritrophin-1-like n=1 Tax=Macrobrachium rosenbergii TaxID=79674 RepID=UPI0034D6E29B